MNVICKNCNCYGTHCTGMEIFYTGCVFYNKRDEKRARYNSFKNAKEAQKIVKEQGYKTFIQEFYDEKGQFFVLIEC